MAYSLFLKKAAEKSFEKLSEKDQMKIDTVFSVLREDPFSGKKLKGEFEGFYSVRMWPYRIIYTIFKKELIVLVVDVGHRKEVYKK